MKGLQIQFNHDKLLLVTATAKANLTSSSEFAQVTVNHSLSHNKELITK